MLYWIQTKRLKCRLWCYLRRTINFELKEHNLKGTLYILINNCIKLYFELKCKTEKFKIQSEPLPLLLLSRLSTKKCSSWIESGPNLIAQSADVVENCFSILIILSVSRSDPICPNISESEVLTSFPTSSLEVYKNLLPISLI